jgi:hypothetical protein
MSDTCLWVQESFINATEGYNFGESPVYETSHTDVGKLFRSCMREYGRCVSRVYVDRDGEAMPVGWVFQKRMAYDQQRPRYDDWGHLLKPETYIREVWVTVLDADDSVTRVRHYRDLSR